MTRLMNSSPIFVLMPSLLEANPELAQQWHPTKNVLLTPNDVTHGSNKKAWWVCSQGHEWQAMIKSRSAGTGCPHCAGKKKLSADYCLDAVNLTLACEWHPSMNGSLTPQHVTPASAKKIWWVCNKGHEWQATVNKRSSSKRGCPYYCAGKTVCSDNCLQSINLELSRQWHPIKNGSLTPAGVTAYSSKMAWWT